MDTTVDGAARAGSAAARPDHARPGAGGGAQPRTRSSTASPRVDGWLRRPGVPGGRAPWHVGVPGAGAGAGGGAGGGGVASHGGGPVAARRPAPRAAGAVDIAGAGGTREPGARVHRSSDLGLVRARDPRRHPHHAGRPGRCSTSAPSSPSSCCTWPSTTLAGAGASSTGTNWSTCSWPMPGAAVGRRPLAGAPRTSPRRGGQGHRQRVRASGRHAGSVEAGLPRPVLQHPVELGGRRYRIDLAYPEQRVAIELDGSVHLRRDVWEADHERQKALVLAGWTVLRFTWREDDRRPRAWWRRCAWRWAEAAPGPRPRPTFVRMWSLDDHIRTKLGVGGPPRVSRRGTSGRPGRRPRRAWPRTTA